MSQTDSRNNNFVPSLLGASAIDLSAVLIWANPDTHAIFTQVVGDVATSPEKPTNAYGVQAVSEDSTYKYFFFEDDSANWYILRKHKTNKVFSYGKGTGGYSSVYVNSTSGPSPAPTWGSYGSTF